ncbi:MAG: hypothetical protein MZV70_19820 [Desulfobacterales bacterium]|nr:hypothetical protein [Desulfobacterales bacterium]
MKSMFSQSKEVLRFHWGFGASFLHFSSDSSACLWSGRGSQRKADIRKMAKDTLTRLYKAQPSAKKAVEGAAGYAVFSNFGMKIFVAGGW